MIAKYGYNTVGFIVLIIFLLLTVGYFTSNTTIKYILYIAGMALLIFTLIFFRDPERTPPATKDVVISPADGKVIVIKKVVNHHYIEGEAWQVSIFMSPLNVHVNRIPISGVVDYAKYVPGKFLTAFNEKADTENERTEIGIMSEHGKVFFTQVAGMMARRIVFNLNEGDSVEIAKRFGMIKFGSRSDIIVPIDWEINVKTGQSVTAGETILFRKNEEKI